MQLFEFIASIVPMILVQCCILFINVITTMHLGKGDTAWLAGASLGGLVFNVFGLMLVVAPMTALDTVAPQAWGAGHRAEVGLSTQRAFITAILFLLPAMALWSYAEDILLALGQPPRASELAASYLQVLLPALPIQAVFESSRRFLYAQSIRWPPLLAAAIGTALHPLWLTLLVDRIGFTGGPLAILCTHTVFMLLLLSYILLVRPHHPSSWPGVRPIALIRDRRACMRFLTLSLAGLLALSEWLFWEVVCFRAGRFGRVPLAVHGTAYSIVPLAFMVPLGLSIGVSNAVGQLLGAGQVAKAKRLAMLSMALGVGLVCLVSASVFLARDPIVGGYTSDDEVIEGARRIWPWLFVDLFFDGAFALLSGLGRGLGLQRRTSACIVLCLWPIGVPLVFVAPSLEAIWMVMPAIYLALDLSVGICCACADWAKIAEAIKQAAPLAADDSAAMAGASSAALSDDAGIVITSSTATDPAELAMGETEMVTPATKPALRVARDEANTE